MRTGFRFRRTAVVLTAGLLAVSTAALAQGPSFDRYVSIGDSLTAGFMSSGLVSEVQVHSYPAHIFRQTTGGPTQAFAQPLVSAPGIPPLLQLASLQPLVIAPAAGLGSPINLQFPAPYHNLGVPGARIDDVVNTVTDNGGLHDLILRGQGTQLQQAAIQSPTFATIWIGNNDVLAAATTGVVIEGVTLTSVADFDAKLRTIVGTLRGVGADLAIANLPDVTAIPFVTTIPPFVVNPATNQPVLVNGATVPLIGPGGRLLVPGQDYVLLTATTDLAAGRGIPTALGGSGQPLSNQVVLSGDEVATINDRVASFNQIIRSVANDSGAALVNINSIFRNAVTEGIDLGGITFTPEFLRGGLFSFDGVHATPLGYAIVANAFIRAINNTYDTNVPLVGLGPYVFGSFASAGTGLSVGTASMKLTRGAEDQIRFVLGVPNRQGVHQLLLANQGNGGGGGGNGGGNGDGGNGGGGQGDGGACPLPRGHGQYCDVCGPCGAGQGDCDNRPGQCEEGLTCVQDVGAAYGFHPKIDICQ